MAAAVLDDDGRDAGNIVFGSPSTTGADDLSCWRSRQSSQMMQGYAK